VPRSRRRAAPNVARTRTLAGVGYLDYQPGEDAVVGIGASSAATGIGLREYLPGEEASSGGSSELAPSFGPQP
jgi:hypothetical protein